MISTAIGTCDICNAENVEVCRCIVSGIETFACDECRCNEPKAEPVEAIKPQHTPGPWKAHKVNGAWWIGSEDRNIGAIFGDIGHPWNDADALVFAAGPDMLALLQELIAIEGPQPGNVEWYRKVKTVIAKATGDA